MVGLPALYSHWPGVENSPAMPTIADLRKKDKKKDRLFLNTAQTFD
jgi:hypothetical protein